MATILDHEIAIEGILYTKVKKLLQRSALGRGLFTSQFLALFNRSQDEIPIDSPERGVLKPEFPGFGFVIDLGEVLDQRRFDTKDGIRGLKGIALAVDGGDELFIAGGLDAEMEMTRSELVAVQQFEQIADGAITCCFGLTSMKSQRANFLPGMG